MIDQNPRDILFVMYGWNDTGGGTILPRQIVRSLTERGHRVSVVYTPSRFLPDQPPYHVEVSEEQGVTLYAVYNRPVLFYDLDHPEREVEDPAMRQIFAAILDERQPDLVHYHSFLNFSMAIAEETSKRGIPSVYTSHNYWPLCPRMYLFEQDLRLCPGPSEDGKRCAACIGVEKSADYAARRAQGIQVFARHVDRHLAVSQRVRELFVANGHDPSRIRVLPQAPQTVDPIWREIGRSRQIVEKLERPLKVGFFGSLLPLKGVHVLIQSLQAFEVGEIEAEIFGSGPDRYEEWLRELDWRGMARFHGAYSLEDLPRLLAGIDVAVVAPVTEDCAPLVLAEVLAARCPAVGSRIGGTPDFIEDGVTGFLFEPRDPHDLARVLRRFLEDPTLLGRMQRNIRPPRTFDDYLLDLLEHYEEVIGQSSSLEGMRSRAFLHCWEGSSWREVVVSYAETFAGHEDATLVLWLDPAEGVSREEAERWILQLFEERGLSPEAIPDLLLVLDALSERHVEHLFQGVEGIVPGGSRSIELAQMLGKPLIENWALPSKRIPSKVCLCWEGDQFAYHSLAHINREICSRLIESGMELCLYPYGPDEFSPESPQHRLLAQHVDRHLSPDVHVCHRWPPRLDPPLQGAWVMIQPWEFGGVPAEWVVPMRELMDEIWVPSSYVKDGYVKSGIPAEKVVVIPNGVKVERYRPDAPPYPLETKKRIKFLYVGGIIERKGIDILIDTYIKTFTSRDDVCLVIKGYEGLTYRGSFAKNKLAQYQANPDLPEIEYINSLFTDEEMAGVYTACDCLVHPYRGEGFGMPIAEAMASGLPVIVTGYGACLDFCDDENSFLIPAKEITVNVPEFPNPSIGFWLADPDRQALAQLMRQVVSDPELAVEKGRKARKRILDGFQWERVVSLVSERLEVLAKRTPVRFQHEDPFFQGNQVFPLERKRVAFFHHPDWRKTDWEAVLLSYAEAFRTDEDSTLVLWLDPSQGVSEEEAGDRITRLLEGAGLDPERIPDLLLVPQELDLLGLASLYRACDRVVPAGDPLAVERAGKLGKSCLTDLTKESWLAALESARCH